MGTLPPGFFLMRGQSDSNQAAIAFGSRSRATRSGLYGVNPRSRNQVLRYRGLSPTPNSSRISSPNRAAVQSSVSKPWCVGLSVSQRRATFSCVAVSLLGRPDTGLTSRPSSPTGAEGGQPPPHCGGIDTEEVGDFLGRVSLGDALDSEPPSIFQLVR